MTIDEVALDWRLSRQRDGISLYTSDVPGSPYKAYRASMEVKGSMDAYLAVFDEVHEYKNWMHTTIISELVERPSEVEKVIYMVNRNLPINDRDYYASLLTKYHDDGRVTVDWSLVDKPAHKKRIRLSKMNVRISLFPLAEGEFRVQLDGHVEPGGVVPSVVANVFVTDVPFNTFKKVRKQVAKRAR